MKKEPIIVNVYLWGTCIGKLNWDFEKHCSVFQFTDEYRKQDYDICPSTFHVEFCVQDAKQFTELTDCQSRDLDKLYFHFNTTLTSGNLAKTEAFEKGVVFSMATVKVLFHNIFLM